MTYTLQDRNIINSGKFQDFVTGGACAQDPSGSGLPDGHCMFYASQDSTASSSIMSLPYLQSQTDFCDDETGMKKNKVFTI